MGAYSKPIGFSLRDPGCRQVTTIISLSSRLQGRLVARPFEGIIFPDVSEFESYMPSHAVWSLCVTGTDRAVVSPSTTGDARSAR